METPASFRTISEAGLEPIIAYGLDSAMVALYTIRCLTRLGGLVVRPQDAATLKHLVGRVLSQAQVRLRDAHSLAELLALTQNINEHLDQKFSLAPP